jgi:hypothetical protein
MFRAILQHGFANEGTDDWRSHGYQGDEATLLSVCFRQAPMQAK